nr:immunoglobulin heavy chain junction region [Mus musculus]
CARGPKGYAMDFW